MHSKEREKQEREKQEREKQEKGREGEVERNIASFDRIEWGSTVATSL